MFQLFERLSPSGAGPGSPRRYLKRAGLFAAGLFLLWVSMQLLPSQHPPVEPHVYSDDAGTVAARPDEAPGSAVPPLFTAGNAIALLVLVGGVYLAVYLRRRTHDGGAPTPIRPLAEYAIGPNQSLRLVECGREVLLIGVTSGQVSLLRTYPLDRFDAELREDRPPLPDHFADVLHRYAGRQDRTAATGLSS